jgi:hypothetical protein
MIGPLLGVPADGGPVAMPVPGVVVVLLLLALVVAVLVARIVVPRLRLLVGLRRLERLHPDALVLAARRPGDVVGQIDTFLHHRGAAAATHQTWVPLLIDREGISPWYGLRPTRLTILNWQDIPEIEAREALDAEGRTQPYLSVRLAGVLAPLQFRLAEPRSVLLTPATRVQTAVLAARIRAFHPALGEVAVPSS